MYRGVEAGYDLRGQRPGHRQGGNMGQTPLVKDPD